MIKKTLYTLAVDNYSPEITKLTFPYLEKYADKIGASFFVIDQRRRAPWPVVAEKMQIFELSRELGDDWSLYVDADCLIHPDMFDVTEVLPRDTVMQNAKDFASERFRYDDTFRRDGRNIGACNWFTVASSWCRDLWAPMDIPCEEAVANITPIQAEVRAGINPEHLIDDYMLSRNIARFGLKYMTLRDFVKDNTPNAEYLWHPFGNLDGMLEQIRIDPLDLDNEAKKVVLLRHVMEKWKLPIPEVGAIN